MATSVGRNADLVFGVAAVVLGVLLLTGALSLEIILGLALLVLGIMVLARRM